MVETLHRSCVGLCPTLQGNLSQIPRLCSHAVDMDLGDPLQSPGYGLGLQPEVLWIQGLYVWNNSKERPAEQVFLESEYGWIVQGQGPWGVTLEGVGMQEGHSGRLWGPAAKGRKEGGGVSLEELVWGVSTGPRWP